MPWPKRPLAIARFFTPGYAFARVWSVGIMLLFGLGSQSGLLSVAGTLQSQGDVVLQSFGAGIPVAGSTRSKMQAYSMSPWGTAGLHSWPLIGFVPFGEV